MEGLPRKRHSQSPKAQASGNLNYSSVSRQPFQKRSGIRLNSASARVYGARVRIRTQGTMPPARDAQLAERKDIATLAETSLGGCGAVAAGLTAITASKVNSPCSSASANAAQKPKSRPKYESQRCNPVTRNAMGLTAVLGNFQQLLSQMGDGRSLDIVVLTDTMLIPKQHGKRWLKPLLES